MIQSPHGRGICPVCEREMNLTKNGKLRHHGGPVGSDPNNWLNRRAYRCNGAGQDPAADTGAPS